MPRVGRTSEHSTPFLASETTSSGEAGARHITPALATAHIAEPSLIDCEEDRTLRAVLVGMLREGDR